MIWTPILTFRKQIDPLERFLQSASPTLSSDSDNNPSSSNRKRRDSTAMSSRHRSLAKGDACTACNVRKIRCTGQRPACEKCVKKSRQCIYPNDALDHGEAARSSTSTSSSSNIGPVRTTHTAHTSSVNPTGSATNGTPEWPMTEGEIDWLSLLNNSGIFLPSIETADEEAQAPPSQWDDIDFSWLQDSSTPEATTELDETTRQHLLFLYFSNQRRLGLEFYILRFYERLEHPILAYRPHPALLNALYLAACKLSPLNWVRNLEKTFFAKARDAFEEALGDILPVSAPLLDLTRAARILAVWLWAESRDAEAVMWTAKAVRCAIACQLDQIPSAIFKPQPTINIRRHRPMFCYPVQDQIDLTERIYIFWSIFLLDACSAVGTSMPANFDLDTVTTPLPWSWTVAEQPDAHRHATEERLQDLYSTTTSLNPDEHGISEMSFLYKAIYLLYRACYIHSRFQDSMDPERLARVIQRFIDTLPTQFKATSPGSAGSLLLDQSSATLNIIITCAQILLFDNNSYNGPNDRALLYAKRLVGLIRMSDPVDLTDLGLAMYSFWQIVLRVLIRESKRLRQLGDEIGASITDTDIQVMVETLESKGGDTAMLQGMLEGIGQLRLGPPSEVDEQEVHYS